MTGGPTGHAGTVRAAPVRPGVGPAGPVAARVRLGVVLVRLVAARVRLGVVAALPAAARVRLAAAPVDSAVGEAAAAARRTAPLHPGRRTGRVVLGRPTGSVVDGPTGEPVTSDRRQRGGSGRSVPRATTVPAGTPERPAPRRGGTVLRPPAVRVPAEVGSGRPAGADRPQGDAEGPAAPIAASARRGAPDGTRSRPVAAGPTVSGRSGAATPPPATAADGPARAVPAAGPAAAVPGPRPLRVVHDRPTARAAAPTRTAPAGLRPLVATGASVVRRRIGPPARAEHTAPTTGRVVRAPPPALPGATGVTVVRPPSGPRAVRAVPRVRPAARPAAGASVVRRRSAAAPAARAETGVRPTAADGRRGPRIGRAPTAPPTAPRRCPPGRRSPTGPTRASSIRRSGTR
ncbi:hypothetical protein SAMN05660991_02146 [Trujillonella endophytica]|uniref:Uncharacterized protein n=1 Tax=Trujillonella endophytica TaxID=673521 RepID=A0A1H8T8R5_9ACTN|nr:hypothetical protein SAMN05660991_02146 [Trujillella endophytica]